MIPEVNRSEYNAHFEQLVRSITDLDSKLPFVIMAFGEQQNLPKKLAETVCLTSYSVQRYRSHSNIDRDSSLAAANSWIEHSTVHHRRPLPSSNVCYGQHGARGHHEEDAGPGSATRTAAVYRPPSTAASTAIPSASHTIASASATSI